MEIIPSTDIVVFTREQVAVSTVLHMPNGYEGPSRWVVKATGADKYAIGDIIIPNLKHAGKTSIDNQEYLFIAAEHIFAKVC